MISVRDGHCVCLHRASENLATPLHSHLPKYPSSLHSSPKYGAAGPCYKIGQC